MLRKPNVHGVRMGYWHIDCIVVLLVILGFSLVIVGLLFSPHLELVLISLYIGVGSLLLVIAIMLSWHPENEHSRTLTEDLN
jgi:hypothetical protein